MVQNPTEKLVIKRAINQLIKSRYKCDPLPASAGTTQGFDWAYLFDEDHPRPCGDHLIRYKVRLQYIILLAFTKPVVP